VELHGVTLGDLGLHAAVFSLVAQSPGAEQDKRRAAAPFKGQDGHHPPIREQPSPGRLGGNSRKEYRQGVERAL